MTSAKSASSSAQTPDKVNKIKQEYQDRLEKLQSEVKKLKTAQKEHAKLLKNQSQYQQQMDKLRTEVQVRKLDLLLITYFFSLTYQILPSKPVRSTPLLCPSKRIILYNKTESTVWGCFILHSKHIFPLGIFDCIVNGNHFTSKRHCTKRLSLQLFTIQWSSECHTTTSQVSKEWTFVWYSNSKIIWIQCTMWSGLLLIYVTTLPIL